MVMFLVMKPLIRTLWLIFFMLFVPAVAPSFASTNLVKNIYVVEEQDSTKIVFNLQSKASYDAFRLVNPDRIVVDINQSELDTRIPTLSRYHDVIKNIRSAERSNKARRFVIDTKGKVDYQAYRLKPNKDYSHRLVVELKHQNVTQTRSSTPMQKVSTASVAPANSSQKNYRDIVIAIDAGHGGQDPGAIGKRGTREKDVVLNIAKQLKKLVDNQPGMRGVLVRTSDTYISLRERINIARRAQADMFISIHADAYQNRMVKGSSVYVLSERGASDEAAKWLADQENAADLIGGVSLGDKDATLAKVLLDLSQTATIESSALVADDVLSEIRKVAPVHKTSVQHARFVVLKSPDIPSLLVETAFISNPSEEQRLNSHSYQDKLARAMLKGIKKYFEKYPLPDTRVAQQSKVLKVKAGDTLSELAQAYQVSVARLKRHNKLKSDRLIVGQTLQIPF